VEDSWPAWPAKGAGMWAVGITHTYADDGDREEGGPTAIIDGILSRTLDPMDRTPLRRCPGMRFRVSRGARAEPRGSGVSSA